MKFKFPVKSPYTIATIPGQFVWYSPIAGHRGYDIARYNGIYPVSFPVLCPQDGTIIERRWHYQGGNILVIKHEEGYKSWMAHFDRTYSTVGSFVHKGEVIGESGNTGKLTKGTHLHWHLYLNGKVVGKEMEDLIIKDETMWDKLKRLWKSKFDADDENQLFIGVLTDQNRLYLTHKGKKRHITNPNEYMQNILSIRVKQADIDKMSDF